MTFQNVSQYSINDLLDLMGFLRTPEVGCPWDLRQTYQTIAPSTLEEAYEVVDAIEKEDVDHLREELGDLLFQVIFYAQLGKEDGKFSFAEIVNELTEKLLRRHPHVFPDGKLQPPTTSDKTLVAEEQVKQQWESIKSQERSNKGHKGILDDVPGALPATNRAMKLQKRAAAVGFDWPNLRGVQEKINEELDEVREAIYEGNHLAIEHELGDLLFSVINLCRHVKVDPETCLRKTNRRFTSRFESMEKALHAAGKSPTDLSEDEWNRLWRNAKIEEAQG